MHTVGKYLYEVSWGKEAFSEFICQCFDRSEITNSRMTESKKVLLVEDDPSLGFVIKDNLLIKGYDVTLCKDGEEGEDAFYKTNFNLCIFDVMLPKKDGFSLARSIREK